MSACVISTIFYFGKIRYFMQITMVYFITYFKINTKLEHRKEFKLANFAEIIHISLL